MLDTFSHIFWILFGFLTGFLLRRGGVAKADDAAFLFRLVFYVCVPAIVFNSLATIHITNHLIVFTLFAALLFPAGFFVGRAVVSRLKLPALRKPVFIMASMGLNSLFTLPYLQSLYGVQGVARYIAYDVANTILLYSWCYAVAVKANPHHGEMKNVVIKKLAKSPPLYAVALGLLVNVIDLQVPSFVLNTTSVFSAPTGFLLTLAIGIYLDPKRDELATTLKAIAVRTGTALAVGLLLIAIFNLEGVDRTAVLLFCVAPLAFSSATFASLEHLDVKFAAGMLSVSLAIAIVLETAVALVFA